MAYYTAGTPATANTLARAENIATELTTIVAAFDKVPEQLSLEQGRAAYALDTGAADAYLLALPATLLAYTTGLTIIMKAVNANTGASTVNVDSLGVKSIKRVNGDALVAGDIPAGSIVTLHYDGTNFRTGGDAVTAAAASAAAAATSETNAATSETNAASSASAAAASAAAFFPSGTVMLFHQSAAPTGWTKDTAATLNDAALRVVTSTAWASGKAGATAFSSVFGSGKVAGSTTLTGGQSGTSAHLHTAGTYAVGAHVHVQSTFTATNASDHLTASIGNSLSDTPTNTNMASTASTQPSFSGSSANSSEANADDSHTHTLSLDLHHIMIIIATKD